MDKPTKKKPKYHELVLNRLKVKYGVSQRFITMSIGGDRDSETSESIKKDYLVMVRSVIDHLKGL